MHGLATGDTNASESFNCVLQRLQDWDERPVDVIARGFLLLCQYHDTEILRGRYGMGDLTLKSSLSKVLKYKLRNYLMKYINFNYLVLLAPFFKGLRHEY